MTSLYEDLGVTPDADDDEIKAAFRRKAKESHPDAGGDEREFHVVQRAWLILRDPERRARYDSTGEADDAPDNSLAELVQAINHFLNVALSRPFSPYTDLVKLMANCMGDEERKGTASISTCQGEQAKLEKIAKRFRYDGDRVDIIGAALADRITAIKRQIDETRRRIDLLKTASAYVSDYGYEVDGTPAQALSAFIQFDAAGSPTW